jgi:hypothetical protein
MFQYVLKGIGHVVLERGKCGKGKLHIVKDIVVLFREVLSCDPSIHPSIHPYVPSSIHGWHHTWKKTLAKINNPPSAHVLLFRKSMPSPRGGHPQDFGININNKPNIYSPHNA